MRWQNARPSNIPRSASTLFPVPVPPERFLPDGMSLHAGVGVRFLMLPSSLSSLLLPLFMGTAGIILVAPFPSGVPSSRLNGWTPDALANWAFGLRYVKR